MVGELAKWYDTKELGEELNWEDSCLKQYYLQNIENNSLFWIFRFQNPEGVPSFLF
jgi:hypothetical protein